MSLPATMPYRAILQARRGLEVDFAAWTKGQAQIALLRQQTVALAERLERMGIKTHRTDSEPIFLVDVETGEFKELEAFRNIGFLPLVDSRNKRNDLKALSCFKDQSEQPLRMGVLSAGWVKLDGDLRQAIRHFRRTISRWASMVASPAGVELLLSRLEFTIHRDLEGVPWINLHCHAIYRVLKRQPKEEWEAWLERTRAFFEGAGFKRYFHDSKLRKPQEAIKYCYKPAELDGLSDQELAALFEATLGLKLTHPHNSFADFRAELAEAKLKLVKVPFPAKPGQNRIEWDWKTTPRASSAKQEKNGSGNSSNIVLSILPPAPITCPSFDVHLLVANFDGDLEGLLKARNLEWLRQSAPTFLIKDTCTTTVPTNEPPRGQIWKSQGDHPPQGPPR